MPTHLIMESRAYALPRIKAAEPPGPDPGGEGYSEVYRLMNRE
jgi:hypothetical protein